MKEFAFVDLHIHTKHSYEDGCDISVEELLDTLQAMAQKQGKDVAFSITDHESILGAIEANELLTKYPEKYNRLKFIPGIEINTSLKSVEINKDGKSTYSKCHMLGYGYDLNDKNLIVYSKLMHKSTIDKNPKKPINTGRQLCWARKELEKHYQKSLPFKIFEPCVQCETHLEVRQKFIDIVSKYLYKDKAEIEEFIKNYFDKIPQFSGDAVGRAKLDIFEVIRMIKSAGGKTSIAHPGAIKFEKQDFNSYGQKLDYYKRFVKIVQDKSNNGLDAMEIIHKSNTSPYIFYTLYDIVKQYNMYITCGSDHHGSLYPHCILSRCFSPNFDYASLSPQDKNGYSSKAANVVVSLPFLDDYFEKDSKYSRYNFLCKHKDGKYFSIGFTSKVLQEMKNKQKDTNKHEIQNKYAQKKSLKQKEYNQQQTRQEQKNTNEIILQ